MAGFRVGLGVAVAWTVEKKWRF